MNNGNEMLSEDETEALKRKYFPERLEHPAIEEIEEVEEPEKEDLGGEIVSYHEHCLIAESERSSVKHFKNYGIDWYLQENYDDDFVYAADVAGEEEVYADGRRSRAFRSAADADPTSTVSRPELAEESDVNVAGAGAQVCRTFRES